MKIVHVLSRIAFLSLAAAAFVGLTYIYGRSVRLPLSDPHDRAVRAHRPSGPHATEFPEFLADAIVITLYAVAGHVVFRLRLSTKSHSNKQPVILSLHKGSKARTVSLHGLFVYR